MSGAAPRQHHYVPEAYLAGFTADGTRNGMLWVTDRADKKQFQTKPNGTAKERDFYTVARKDGGDVQGVEKWLGENIDARGAEALKRLGASATLPDGDEFEWLMLFIASMVVRGPYFRSRVDSFVEDVIKRTAALVANSDAAFKTFVADLPQEVREAKGFSEADSRDLLRSDGYKVNLPTTNHVGHMLESLVPLAHMLGSRNWAVIEAADADVNFVCSDQPVSLVPKTAQRGPFPVTFSTPETLLFFPISRRIAVVGQFEGKPFAASVHSSIVAHFNRCTACQAVRYVYSPSREILWLNRECVKCGTGDFLRLR